MQKNIQQKPKRSGFLPLKKTKVDWYRCQIGTYSNVHKLRPMLVDYVESRYHRESIQEWREVLIKNKGRTRRYRHVAENEGLWNPNSYWKMTNGTNTFFS